MSGYMTEEEQLAAIKRWWNKYSNIITTLLSVILLVIAGFKYWNWHQEKISTQASNIYERLMVAFANQNTNNIQAYANQLIKDYGKTVYSDAARLILAKVLVSEENYPKAQQTLEKVVEHSKMPALQQVAKLRIARLLIAEKAYDKALKELNVLADSAYLPMVNELKGDIFVATGNYQKAISSYKEAIAQVRINGMGNLFLEMKTNELAAHVQSTKTNENPSEPA